MVADTTAWWLSLLLWWLSLLLWWLTLLLSILWQLRGTQCRFASEDESRSGNVAGFYLLLLLHLCWLLLLLLLISLWQCYNTTRLIAK